MTLRVWKYTWPLRPVSDHTEFRMPAGAQILCAHRQDENGYGNICIWARVDDEQMPQTRKFVLCGTGHEAPSMDCVYVGTAHLHHGKLILHVFEEF